ncbi:hypothetical protein OROHE_022322 [Orobanche hederae]
MAKVFLSAFVVFLSLISVCNLGLARGANAASQTWCVAKPSSDEKTLQNHINYVCIEQGLDCRTFKQKQQLCSSPNIMINHASIAMNIYYQNKGRNTWNCHFNNTGLITTTDPSYGSCKYA